MSDPNQIIAGAIHEALIEHVGEYHWASDGILLFSKEGERIGTIDFAPASRSAFQALCAAGGRGSPA